MGSKSRIAKYITPIIQRAIDKNGIRCYYEPFCGGANVIDKIKCEHKIGADSNRYLIALLKRVKDDLPLLGDVTREMYNEAREHKDDGEYPDWYIGNVGFLASYNGRYFDGGFANPGYEKTKNGERYRNYYQEAKNNLLKQAKDLRDIEFWCQDYKNFIPKGLVVYCDPPYANTKKYSNAASFNYDEFWETMRNWSKENIVFISEETAPDDFIAVWEKEVSRSIKATDKSVSTEKLFIYNQC